MRRLIFAIALVSAMPARADWEVKRSPFDARLVAGYKEKLHRNGQDAEAVDKLLALYRKYRTVVELQKELEAAAQKTGDAQDWLAVGTLAVHRSEFAQAIAAYKHVLARAPDDATTHLLLGDAYLHVGQSGDARAEYASALAGTRAPPLRKRLLQKLADCRSRPIARLPPASRSQRRANITTS